MSIHEQAEMRARQADAMAKAQAWGLAVHACAIHHGHPHANSMMSDDMLGLRVTGGEEFVVVALAELLAEEIGHQRAIKVVSETMEQRPAVNLTFAVAGALAIAVEWDGDHALLAQRHRQAEGEWYGILADCLKQLDHEDDDETD